MQRTMTCGLHSRGVVAIFRKVKGENDIDMNCDNILFKTRLFLNSKILFVMKFLCIEVQLLLPLQIHGSLEVPFDATCVTSLAGFVCSG